MQLGIWNLLDVEKTLIYLSDRGLCVLIEWMKPHTVWAGQCFDEFCFQTSAWNSLASVEPRGCVWKDFSSTHWNLFFPYLAPSGVELQRRQVGVKDHVTSLDVDGRLPLSYGTEVPCWVYQTPEGWDCSGWDEGEETKEENTTVISVCICMQDQTVKKGRDIHCKETEEMRS